MAEKDGIQRLLAAEQEAQAIIAKARKAKSERLKQAKEEAEKELVAFKAEREEQYKRKVAEESSSSDTNVKKLEAEAASNIQQLQDAVNTKKTEVLDLLCGFVTKVQL